MTSSSKTKGFVIKARSRTGIHTIWLPAANSKDAVDAVKVGLAVQNNELRMVVSIKEVPYWGNPELEGVKSNGNLSKVWR